MVPALNILAGIPGPLALGATICQMLGPATTGLLHRYEGRHLILQLPVTMIGGLLVGLYWGFVFLDWAEGPEVDQILLISYFVLLCSLTLLFSSEWIFATKDRSQRSKGFLSKLQLPPIATFPELKNKQCSLPILGLLATLIGFLSGGMGIGGGVVLVPAFIFLLGISTHEAISAALALTWFSASVATCGHAWQGNVDLRLVCLLLVGGTIGAKIGSILGERWAARRLRGYFTLVVLGAAIMVGIRLFPTLF
ncbi:Hypothetical protein PBC10988_6430 [Planctomycetales bacterium 10988]|nr:Hypothetical protein PBC10988_6430 [Planctomycetales bacterium 10988]